MIHHTTVNDGHNEDVDVGQADAIAAWTPDRRLGPIRRTGQQNGPIF